jgi:DNA invertase Pin-like site-specific DNA recombinase
MNAPYYHTGQNNKKSIMTKITLPALLREGYNATRFYTEVCGIQIENSDGFQTVGVLPQKARTEQRGAITKLYIDGELVGQFEPNARIKLYRFITSKPYKVPEKQIYVGLNSSEEFKPAPPKYSPTYKPASTFKIPDISDIPEWSPEYESGSPKKRTKKQARTAAEPTGENNKKGRPKGTATEETKRKLFDAEDKVREMLAKGMSKASVAAALDVHKVTLYAFMNAKGIVKPTKEELNQTKRIKVAVPPTIAKAQNITLNQTPPPARKKERNKRADNPQIWIDAVAKHGKDIVGISKELGYTLCTCYRRLNKFVPENLWRTAIKPKEFKQYGCETIPKDINYWVQLFEFNNGDFSKMAKDVGCTTNTAFRYYNDTGARREVKRRKKANRAAALDKSTRPSKKKGDKVSPYHNPEYWVALFEKHGTVKAVSEHIGKSAAMCYHYAALYVPKPIYTTPLKENQTKPYWLKMYEDCQGDFDQMAAEAQLKIETVKLYFRQSGAAADIRQLLIAQQTKNPNFRSSTSAKLKDHIDDIKDLLAQGNSLNFIAKKYNVRHNALFRFANENGIPCEKRIFNSKKPKD